MIICYTVPEIWCMTDVIIFHFGPFFGLPPHPNSPKTQNLKKLKNTPGDIIILHKCTKNHIICYIVPEIWDMTDVIIIFRFGLFFALNSLKNQN